VLDWILIIFIVLLKNLYFTPRELINLNKTKNAKPCYLILKSSTYTTKACSIKRSNRPIFVGNVASLEGSSLLLPFTSFGHPHKKPPSTSSTTFCLFSKQSQICMCALHACPWKPNLGESLSFTVSFFLIYWNYPRVYPLSISLYFIHTIVNKWALYTY
jgi:hypothetical protein